MAKHLVGFRAVRLPPQHQTNSLCGFRRPSQCEQCMGTGELKRRCWPLCDRLCDQILGHGWPVGLQRQRTEGMQRLRMPWGGSDDLPIDLFCFRQAPGDVQLLPLPEERIDLLRAFTHDVGVARAARIAQ